MDVAKGVLIIKKIISTEKDHIYNEIITKMFMKSQHNSKEGPGFSGFLKSQSISIVSHPLFTKISLRVLFSNFLQTETIILRFSMIQVLFKAFATDAKKKTSSNVR